MTQNKKEIALYIIALLMLCSLSVLTFYSFVINLLFSIFQMIFGLTSGEQSTLIHPLIIIIFLSSMIISTLSLGYFSGTRFFGSILMIIYSIIDIVYMYHKVLIVTDSQLVITLILYFLVFIVLLIMTAKRYFHEKGER